MNKGKILAVDDTPANLEVIAETLNDAGYAVSTAIDGSRAIQRVQKFQPDLILLDVMMPIMDGFETCRQLKSNPDTASIPVIFITASADAEHKVKSFSIGGVDYITKPFHAEEMLARVNTHLSLQRLNQHLEEQVVERTQTLEVTLSQLRDFQLQLVQREKMSTLGNLVTGIAHEINNPVGFLKGNINPAQTYVQELFELIDFLLQECPNDAPHIQEKLADVDFEFIYDDLPKLLKSMDLGIDRLRSISNSLRIFARKDQEQKTRFNLHEGLESTLLLLKHRTKDQKKCPAVNIIKHYGEIPDIHCFPGQLNQVFMNLLANALDAFDEVNKDRTLADIKANPNEITIQTDCSDSMVMVQIRDNGCGMSPETQARIFEQGFTTKGVGKGTGLGMAIAHQIVVNGHGGHLAVQSEMGRGTEFYIQLPL